MIKRLRRNFLLAAMASVIAVIVVIVAVMNIANYINSDTEADALLELLTENNGSFGQPSDKPGGDIPPGSDRQERPTGETPPEKRDGAEHKPEKKLDSRASLTAETPYETRFFTVILKDSGEPYSIDTGKIAAVTADDALEMARRLKDAGSVTGYEGVYKYLASSKKDGTLYVFVDRSRSLRSVRDFALISVLVALGACAAVFVLAFIFSGIAIKPIAESYEKQKKFITNAGHELKTPLAVINSCTEVIELEQGESKWTKGIATQTERLSQLTKDLVALARMDEGGAQLTIEEFSLSETAEEVIDPFMLMAEHKGLPFTADIQEGVICKGDRNALAQLCSILADNAVKYTPEGGKILFSLKRKGKHITLSSENTAENVSKGAHPELFDRFSRGDSSHSSDTPGYGIGLSMAQAIVTAHGGRIEAFGKDGKSLTVTARL